MQSMVLFQRDIEYARAKYNVCKFALGFKSAHSVCTWLSLAKQNLISVFVVCHLLSLYLWSAIKFKLKNNTTSNQTFLHPPTPSSKYAASF